VKEETTMLFEN